MDLVVPSLPALAAFLAASLLLAITPGPGVLYIVARTLAQGRAAGLASVGGVALGNFGNAVAAAVGLAALFAMSSAAFTLVKWAGAAYLVFLGIQALRAPVAEADAAAPGPASPARIFRQGLLVALLNPKTTLFFAAFLPQFVQASASAGWQCLVLSLLFVAIAAVTDSAYVLLAALLAPALRSRRARRGTRWVAACTYIGLGVFTAMASRPGAVGPR
jgi:threonine/homoserine/homoserine lactone efflux protein